MTPSTTDLRDAATSSLGLHELLVRIERRLGDTRTFGRDVDALFHQLVDRVRSGWPPDGESALSVALFALRLAEAWAARCPDTPPRILGLTADLAIVELARTMADVDAHWADELVQTWEAASVETRELLAILLIDRGRDGLHRALDRHLTMRLMQVRSPGAAITSAATSPHRGRDLARLLALLRAHAGDHDGALAALDDTPTGDPRVLATFAELHRLRGDTDAAGSALKRAMIAASETPGARESWLDAALDRGDVDDIVEALVALVAPGGDLMAWQAVVDTFETDDPQRITRVREALRDASPGAWVTVLIEEHDVDGVLAAAEDRKYAFEHLWRMADFLADHDEKVASKLYERAIKLEGSVARSRAECEAFAGRVERVLPFFERIGKPTRPRRYARDVVKRSRNHVPLKRELERVLGSKL